MIEQRRRHLFNRFFLPGFAFKAVVIGGGYATGRELATFFVPAGPMGGIYGILLATVIWSGLCVLTFLFARQTASLDYRAFFQHLLGPGWLLFEIAFLLALVVILAVFAAAAGSIGSALFDAPHVVGSLALVLGIALFAAFGNKAVEWLFKYVTYFLYATYLIFACLTFTRYGDRIMSSFANAPAASGWMAGGTTYAAYNVIGAIVILPVTRHLTSRRDAVIAGALCGPLAMLPALVFFLCMMAFYPAIGSVELPSDYILARLDAPAFRMIFQAMIFAALLESGVGSAHAINERIIHVYHRHFDRPFTVVQRLGVTLTVLFGAAIVADRVGLVTLIAQGYTWLAYTFIAVYALPLVTYGAWCILKHHRTHVAAA
ncbi:hypothetical protein EQZ23_06690 [Sphingomonas sp. UV9]|uniref:YkvI family membrane protein n=1 Tax=Sphingomonas sp. UV9 TaxID=1851410 RepID=UPI000FFBBC82|nr:hypothetical protein [Sphingomonas sp. UV9]RXD04830.1 hypothetical protein EQZ23_06690 [Sphingomonas sp. UV9]